MCLCAAADVCAYMRVCAMCIIINFKCPNLTARCSLTLTPPKNERTNNNMRYVNITHIRNGFESEIQNQEMEKKERISRHYGCGGCDGYDGSSKQTLFSILLPSFEIKCCKFIDFFLLRVFCSLSVVLPSVRSLTTFSDSIDEMSIWTYGTIRYGGKSHLF